MHILEGKTVKNLGTELLLGSVIAVEMLKFTSKSLLNGDGLYIYSIH